MKRYFYLLGMLLLFCNNIRGQGGGFNPLNPPEPNAQYNLTLQVSPNGAGSLSGNGKYIAGTEIYVNAYNNSGFRFISWKENGNVISTSHSFVYYMPAYNATLTAFFEYDPDSPGEPDPTPQKYTLNLVAQPAIAGDFNISSGSRYNEGSSVHLYAYTNSGFKFREWRDGDIVLSTDRSYEYTMPSGNKTITAIYYYDPDAPSEPNTPTSIEHGLIALNQSGEIGQTIAFPIYLLNHNINVHSVEFDIAFPEGATVNYTNAVLTNRANGQAISVSSQENNVFHYSITGNPDAPFIGSNGILMNIPVTLPGQWVANETHPVKIENVQIATPGGTIASSGKAGALSINQASDYTVLANFYPNKFLNRVYFINLSSETATDFRWNFGDGTTSVEKNPLHVYGTAGNYEVQLIAFNAQKSDTVKTYVEIAPEGTWNISGTLSLNKHKSDIKNFTSVKELFTLLSRSAISGNITIDVEANELFEWNLSPETKQILSIVENKLATGNYSLTFRKDGTSDNPVINFTGEVDPDAFYTLVQLGQYMELKNVEIKILNQPVDILRIYSYTAQKVCSGNTSAPVDFTEISTLFTYNWTLLSAPPTVSGYPVSGSGVIPAATLTTTAATTDTIKYKVSIRSAFSAAELYVFECQIHVQPVMQGELKLLSPAANQTLSSSTVTFSWTEIPNASYYEIKIWDEYDNEPEKALVTNIKNVSHQISAYFLYGKKYNYRVIAVNECNRIESEAAAFAIRYLPNLHVTMIDVLATLSAGAEAQIIYRVQNDGPGATLASEYWFDRAFIIWDMKNPTTSVYRFPQKQNKKALAPGEFYEDTLTVKIPERISGNWYVVVTADMENILSIDWSPVNNTVPLPYTPNKNGIPYPYLKAQRSSSGNLMQEDKETATLTDNFFYTATNIKIPKLPDLQVISVEAPETVAETQTFTLKATIKNAGDSLLAGKTWVDGVWVTKDPILNTATANLLAFTNSDSRLEIGDTYTISFSLTAPVDSMENYYYFVVTDLKDDVYESDETNNRLRSNAVLVLPSRIHADDYANLTGIFNEFGGTAWTNKWDISSSRIANYWQGVTFINGRVTAISLPSNNLAGELSNVFFKFPYLELLNLHDNQLTGSLNALLTGEQPDSLVSLNLGKNRIEGNIPATIANLRYLEELNVSHNRLSEIESALSQTIVRLNIQSQTLPSDSIALSSHPLLSVPSIAQYNHTTGNFDEHPSYSLYRNNERLLGYAYDGKSYVWRLNQSNPKNFVWYFESGTEFSLVQENGLAQGSTTRLTISFSSGDANIDEQVDVLDVQHSLNYIFNEHVSAFNFMAADSYKDNAITVQDLIKTVDIILDSDMISPWFLRSAATNNVLFIRDQKLVLYTEQAVAAMDISLQGISGKEILSQLSNSGFQFTYRDSENGTRFIIFSLSGSIIPAGTVTIAELSGNNASLLRATLSDPSAERIPVKVDGMPTGITPVEMDEISAFAVSGAVYCRFPEKAALVSASLCSLQGIVIEKQELRDVSQGQYRLNFNTCQPGVYILNLTMKSDNRVLFKNIKLIVSK